MKLTDFDALSFDCYGTLIDWEAGLRAVLGPWARSRGLAMSEEELLAAYSGQEAQAEASHPGEPYPAILARSLRGLGDELGAEVTEADAAGLARSVPDWPAFPDSPTALADLARRYRLIILSNVDRDSFAGSNQRLGVRFASVITAQDVGAYKPSARNFEALLAETDRLGVPRGRLLHVAQSLFHDHVPAQAAGLPTVWINRRHDRAGWGATPEPAAPVTPDWEFPSMRAFADEVDLSTANPSFMLPSGGKMTRVAGGLSASWVRRGLVSAAAMVTLTGMTAGPAVASAAATTIGPAPTTWSAAQEIPGTATLNKQYAGIQHALSCASAGNCSVGGYYTDAAGHDQAFVDNETSGTWGTAQEVPGLAKLNVYGAQMYTLSCKTAGNCSAGGDYTDSLRHSQSFVVREKDGTWLAAKEVPGTAALNVGGTSELVSVSCTAAAACSAGGAYVDSSHDEQAYVVSETGGTWGTAKEVPGLAALNTGGDAYITSVSCVSAGNCAAGGYYFTSAGDQEAFVVTQSGGTWGNAQEVPGIGTLNDQQGPLESLSCGSAGNCAAVGSYTDSAGNVQAWLATETGGTWGNAEEIPGTATLNSDGFAVADTVSCKSAGNCSAGGWYTGAQIQAFVVTETGGTWGSAEEVPGMSTLNTSGNAQLWTVSCASAGNCTAGGYYWNDSEGGQEAFVVSQSKGTWGKAEEVPGTEALNVNGGGVTQMISCPTAAHCAVAGEYGVSSGDLEVYVASQT